MEPPSENKLVNQLQDQGSSSSNLSTTVTESKLEIKAGSSIPAKTGRSPSKQNRLFYIKRNPLVQSAEYNVNALKEQFVNN